MSKYRIRRHVKMHCTMYEVQKKSFFGFWYNFNNIDGCTTGFYYSESDARKAIEEHRLKTRIEVINE